MIFDLKRTINKITAGILLPVFLFIASGSIVQAAENPAQSVKISIRVTGSSITTLQRKYSLTNVQKLFASSDPALDDFYTASISPLALPLLQGDRFSANVNLDFAVSSSELIVSPLVIPNDSYFTSDPTFEDKQWYLPSIQMQEAWQYGQGSFNTVVAIIDTGIHSSHLELNDGRVIAGYNTISKTNILGQTDSDDNGHGTAVAGIIGAISNNGQGVTGINWKVSLMPIKALSAGGSGEISAVAAGIVWATDHGANIINMSLGGPGFGADQALNEAVRYAFNHNVVIVSAAGNDLADHGSNLDVNPIYPVCADNGQNMIIGVAASDVMNRKADFSNFGINCVDLTAPGKKILTTAFFPSDPSDNVLLYGSGTSLAAPIVSGVAALLKSNSPALTNVQIRDILLGTADNIDSVNPNNCLNTSCAGFLGKGKINAASAASPNPLIDGNFIRESATGKIYQIKGGKKMYVSQFVFNQRGFDQNKILPEVNRQLASIPFGDPIAPLTGTLVKEQTEPTVYYIDQGIKRPLTYLVFLSRGFSFADVKVLPDTDVLVLKTGEWYSPPDGTMVLITGSPTVYVMDEGVRRAVTYFVFTQRKLSFAKVIKVTPDEFSHVPAAPDPFWLPPQEGTLVKSKDSPAVYVIESKTKRALSGAAFTNRKYKFSDVNTLPTAEMNVIASGFPIIQ